jgi:hypothetical protein
MNRFASQHTALPLYREGTMLDHLTPESMLTRDKAALALSECGYPTSKLSLSTLASRGGGPIYTRFGRRALYRWGNLLQWAKGRCSPPQHNTSEADALASRPRHTAAGSQP